jgi:Starch-binding associating with outer membrane/Susd and RagB outer membrane lipoprotein
MLGLLTFTGCKDFYDVNTDPLHPSVYTADQLLPGTQVAMSTYLGFSLSGLSQSTSTLVSQLNSGRGVGSFQQSGSSFSNQWSGLYNDMLENNELIIKQATEKNQLRYLGVAQLQKAYIFSIMVDMWGDIPYSEALNGTGNGTYDRAPHFDKDSEIYLGSADGKIESLFALIDKGIANVNAGTSINGDLIYQGSPTKWENFGNTLKLKLYNQIRKTSSLPFDLNAQVTALLAQPTKLMQSGEDFELSYGPSFQPENRNISFLSNYVSPSREDFMSQEFFRAMIKRNDPRLPFYFYTQAKGSGGLSDYDTTAVLQPQFSPTGSSITFNFATVKLGSTGTLASASAANLVTLPGLYPGGGRFDFGGGSSSSAGADFTYARGLVAQRFLTVASRYFTEAELQLTVLNDPIAAKAAYVRGLTEAFVKVDAVGRAEGTATNVPTATNGSIPSISPTSAAAATYIRSATAKFNLSSPVEQQLSAIMYEKYVAGFGFGEDIYTDWRRTNFPAIRAPGEVPNTVATGGRPRRLFYDVQEITSNPNAPREQASSSSRIFWDN